MCKKLGIKRVGKSHNVFLFYVVFVLRSVSAYYRGNTCSSYITYLCCLGDSFELPERVNDGEDQRRSEQNMVGGGAEESGPSGV